MEAEADGILHDGQVPQSPGIVAMDTRRGSMTIGAARLGSVGTRLNEEGGLGRVDVLHRKTGQDKGQDRSEQTIGIPHTNEKHLRYRL
jgi:hypothetical protein